MNLRDFVHLCKIAEDPALHLFDADSRAAFLPEMLYIVWPIAYVLGFHKKHVFREARLQKMSSFGSSLKHFVHRLRWRVLLHDRAGSPWRFLQGRSRKCTPCMQPLDEKVECALQHMAAQLHECARRVHSKSKRFRQKGDMFAKLGFRTLKESKFGAMATDKDGGFCLLLKSTILDEKRATVQKCCYERVRSPWNVLDDIRSEAWILAQKAAHILEDDNLKRLLMKGFVQNSKVASTLNLLIKTHKPRGQVAFRALHCAERLATTPFMRMLIWLMKPAMRRLHEAHLCKDSFDLCSRLEALTLVPGEGEVRLIKFDVKEFFMSGAHSDLARTPAADTLYPELFEDIAEFVLSSQFVEFEDPQDEGALYKVNCGSGMGLLCSPDLANLCFYSLAERNFALSSEASALGVRSYLRYMDDGFIGHQGSWRSLSTFCARLREKSRYFKLEFEVHRSSCTFLDLRISIGRRFRSSGKPDYEPYRKETSIAIPLTGSSSHPPAVMSWPAVVATRLMRLSSSASAAAAGRDKFEEWLAVHGVRILPRPARAPRSPWPVLRSCGWCCLTRGLGRGVGGRLPFFVVRGA